MRIQRAKNLLNCKQKSFALNSQIRTVETKRLSLNSSSSFSKKEKTQVKKNTFKNSSAVQKFCKSLINVYDLDPD